MRPVSRYLSKPMLPLGATPVIERIIREAERAGCDPIVVIGGSDDEDLRDYTRRLDLSPELRWTVQDERKGLADALLNGYETVSTGPVAMLLPDNVILGGSGLIGVLEPDFSDRAIVWGTTVVSEEEARFFGNSGDYETGEVRSGDVETVTGLQQKREGRFVDRDLDWPASRLVGRVRLPPRFFEAVGEAEPDPDTGEIDDVPIFRQLIDDGDARAVPIKGDVYDMGEPDRYLRLTSHYYRKQVVNDDD